eukprot:4094852-Amphidinium_carterae.1
MKAHDSATPRPWTSMRHEDCHPQLMSSPYNTASCVNFFSQITTQDDIACFLRGNHMQHRKKNGLTFRDDSHIKADLSSAQSSKTEWRLACYAKSESHSRDKLVLIPSEFNCAKGTSVYKFQTTNRKEYLSPRKLNTATSKHLSDEAPVIET